MAGVIGLVWYRAALRYVPPAPSPLHRSPLARSDRIDRMHDIRDIRAKEGKRAVRNEELDRLC